MIQSSLAGGIYLKIKLVVSTISVAVLLIIGLSCLVFWDKVFTPPKPETPAELKPSIAPPIPEVAYPILNEANQLIGGTVNGQWVGRAEIAKYLAGGEKYRLYSKRSYLGEYISLKTPEAEALFVKHNHYISMSNLDHLIEEAAFSIVGQWDALPRVPVIIEKNLGRYHQIVKSVLNRNGLNEAVKIKRVLSIDLEGDGIDEAIIIASNITVDDLEAIADNAFNQGVRRYSLILLVKEAAADAEGLVIADCYKGLTEYDIPFIADLNGDGQLELMVREENWAAAYTEGLNLCREVIYTLTGDRITRLLEIDS